MNDKTIKIEEYKFPNERTIQSVSSIMTLISRSRKISFIYKCKKFLVITTISAYKLYDDLKSVRLHIFECILLFIITQVFLIF